MTKPTDNREKQLLAKIYWRDLPADSRVKDKGDHYEVDGKIVYWHGREDKQATYWLNTHLSAKDN